MRKEITVRIEKSDIEGYNYKYIFTGKRVYIEYKIYRYMRLLGLLKNIKFYA